MKWALTLCVTTTFGYFCYAAGYTHGRVEESTEMQQTSQAVADAFNRVAALDDDRS